MKLPNNIVENNLSDMPPPDKYAGLVYRWTNLVNLGIYEKTGEEVPIYYDGSHGSDKELTAYVGDGYWHSSKNKEFGKVFSDSSSKLRYEILEYFDLQYDMKMKETKMLRDVDAKNNPLYYNLNNGFEKIIEPDFDLCEEFVEDFESGQFKCIEEPVEDHVGMDWFQARYKDNPKLQIKIANRIDDNGGLPEKSNPILVLEGRGNPKISKDKRYDGNHTVHGINKSKHGTLVKVVRLSEDFQKRFSEADIKFISYLLNKIPEVVGDELDIKDGEKYVVNGHAEGRPPGSDSNKTALKKMGYSTSQIRTIFKNSKDQIEEADLARIGRVFINYDAAPYAEVFEKQLLHERDKKTSSCGMSSGMFKWNTIMETIYAKPEKKDIVVLIKHPSLPAEKKWKKTGQILVMEIEELIIKAAGYNLIIKEMETTKPNKS